MTGGAEAATPTERIGAVPRNTTRRGTLMRWKCAAMAALAVLALGVGTRTARASDVIKLGLNQSAPTVTLDLKPGQDADVEEANWRRGYYGGYRGFYGGYGSY